MLLFPRQIHLIAALLTFVGTVYPCASPAGEQLTRRGLLQSFAAVLAASQIPKVVAQSSLLVAPPPPPAVPDAFIFERFDVSRVIRKFLDRSGVRSLRRGFAIKADGITIESTNQLFYELQQLKITHPEVQIIRDRYLSLTRRVTGAYFNPLNLSKPGQAAKTEVHSEYQTEIGRDIRARLGTSLMYDIVLVRSTLPVTLVHRINMHPLDSEITVDAEDFKLLTDYFGLLKHLQKSYQPSEGGYDLLNTFAADAESWHSRLKPTCEASLDH